MGGHARYAEASGVIGASKPHPEFLDDQANLSAHMRQSSGMMFGVAMDIHMEADHTGPQSAKD